MYRGGVIEFFVAEIGGGRDFIDADFWQIWNPPHSEENDSPLLADLALEESGT